MWALATMGPLRDMLHRMGGRQVYGSGPVRDDSAQPITRDDEAWVAALCDRTSVVATQASGLVAVSPQWDMPLRCLDEHVFYLVTAGGVRGALGERRFTLEPGSLMWIAPGVWHRLALATPGVPFTMYNLRFRLERGAEHIGFARDIYLRRDGWEYQRLVELLFDDLSREHPHRNQRLKHLLHLIWTELEVETARPGDGRLNHTARNRIARYVRDRVAEWPGSADLARLLDLSPDHFRRVFRRTYGCSPRAWLLRERIRLAAMRVADSPQRSLTAIAEDFGYRDPALFSRQFKRVMGCSPRIYRRGR